MRVSAFVSLALCASTSLSLALPRSGADIAAQAEDSALAPSYKRDGPKEDNISVAFKRDELKEDNLSPPFKRDGPKEDNISVAF